MFWRIGTGIMPTVLVAPIRCWAITLLMLLCVTLVPPARANAGLPPPGPNLDLIKAIHADDMVAIAAALDAGASLRDADYGMSSFSPVQLAIVLRRPAALRRLAAAAPDLALAYHIAVMFADRAAFDILRQASPPAPELAADALLTFASRLRPEVREVLIASVVRQINGLPDDIAADWWRWAIPDTATTADAPELALAQTLLDLTGGQPANKDSILASALDAGDVFFADWLLARGIGTVSTTFWSEMSTSAARAANRSGISALIARGQSMNVYDNQGATPLLLAINIGDVQLVASLLAGGAAPNIASRRSGNDDQVKLPLVGAVRSRSLPMVEALIEAGADLNRIDENRNWALREAIRNGSPDIVARLLSSGADPKRRDDLGNTLLHGFLIPDSSRIPRLRKIEPTHLTALNFIGAAGFDFNARNHAGISVLTSALTEGEESETYWTALADLGARPDDRTYHAIVGSGGERIADWLFAKGHGDPNALPDGISLIAEHSSNAGLLQILFKAGARLGNEPENARMATTAIEAEKPVLMSLLLLRGLPPDIRDEVGKPILQAAVERGQAEIVRLLLDGGANPNVTGSPNGSILHALVKSDTRAPGIHLSPTQQDAITLLVDRGFDTARKDYNGKTIFEAADTSVVTAQHLLAAVQRAGGQTRVRLHDAVRANSAAQIQRLLDTGAAIDAPDSLGRSALALALALGRVEAAKLLIRRGAAITFDTPARALPAIIDYAGDARFAALFPLGLLTDQLISLTADAAGDIARFHNLLANARPPNVDWIVTCRNHCRGTLHLVGNSPRYIGLIQSHRRDYKSRAWMAVEISPHEPSSSTVDGGSLGILPLHFDPVFTAKGSVRVPSCEFSLLDQPFCVPGLHFTMGQYSQGRLLFKQGQGNYTGLPGKTITLDRSNGDIEMEFELVEGKSLSMSLKIDYGVVPTIALTGAFDDADRMATYATLAKWRQRRLKAIEALTKEPIPGEDKSVTEQRNRELTVEAKALAAAERHLSALAIEKGYQDVVRLLFMQKAAEVAALDQRMADFRRILQTRVVFSREELLLLVQQIDALISTAPLALHGQLQAIRDGLMAANQAVGATDDAIEVAQDGLFQDVDRVVFQYQSLALELAQYMHPEELMTKIPLTAAQRLAIQTRISPSDVFVRDTALNGWGATLREASGLPEPAP
jgi:uncharacterized protein